MAFCSSASASASTSSRLRTSCPSASTRPISALLSRPATQQAAIQYGARQNQSLGESTFSRNPVVPSHRSASGADQDRSCACHAFDPKDSKGAGKTTTFQLNPAYVAICGGFALLFLFRNPYIFAALTILTIIPQNSAVTSLNSLVLLFYDSGLFMNFAEAVYCVRLISWVSIACTLISFAIFA